MLTRDPFLESCADEAEMVEYVRLMFELHRADAATVRDGIERFVGVRRHSGGCAMNWELRLLVAE